MTLPLVGTCLLLSKLILEQLYTDSCMIATPP